MFLNTQCGQPVDLEIFNSVFTFVLINGPNCSVLVEGNQKLIRNCISAVKYVSGQAIYVTVLYSVHCTFVKNI